MTHVQKETAQLLKEKGFDLPSRQFFSEERDRVSNTQENNPINWNKYQGEYSAPTLHEAAEWLREKGVHVCVKPDGYGKGNELFWVTIVWITYEHLSPKPKILRDTESDRLIYYPTHDQALEAGIVHALKHYVK